MNAQPFSARAVALLAAIVAIGLGVFLVLMAYAPQLGSGRNGGGHALSTSATGFKGLADLLRKAGTDVELIRGTARLDSEPLLIATPGPTTSPKDVAALLETRSELPTLVVLPKWQTQALPGHAGWVRAVGMVPEDVVAGLMADTAPIAVRREGTAQVIAGRGWRPLLGLVGGGVLVAEAEDRPLWIVADPDLFDNGGLATLAGAQRAARIVRHASYDNGLHVAFDLTLNGFGASPNLLKLAFEPPFLALTLCLVAAAVLAALAGAVRFGAPAEEERAVAFGKQALAENAAALLRLARRAHRGGDRFAMLVRDTVARETGARLSGPALDRYLDRLGSSVGGGPRFTELAERARHAANDAELLAAARALHQWKGSVTR